MPLWLIYGLDALTSVAVIVMALAVALVLAGRLHIVAVDDKIAASFCTYYLVLVGRREGIRPAVSRYLCGRLLEEAHALKRCQEEVNRHG